MHAWFSEEVSVLFLQSWLLYVKCFLHWTVIVGNFQGTFIEEFVIYCYNRRLPHCKISLEEERLEFLSLRFAYLSFDLLYWRPCNLGIGKP